MKKTIKKTLAVLLVCVMVLALAACTKTLNGTYTAEGDVVEGSLVFEKENKVKVKGALFGIEIPELIGDALECEYEIDGDEICFTYTILGIKGEMKKSFEKKGSSIFINGMEFVKEK